MFAQKTKTRKYIQPETPVIHLITMDEGIILRGYGLRKEEWTSYEVSTSQGIEVWETLHILTQR